MNEQEWVCDKCAEPRCTVKILYKDAKPDDQSLTKPEGCVITKHGNVIPNWHLKKITVPLFSDVPKEILTIALNTPNCAVCEWYRPEFHNDIDPFTHDICTAQGAKNCDDVYDNERCKILFLNKHAM